MNLHEKLHIRYVDDLTGSYLHLCRKEVCRGRQKYRSESGERISLVESLRKVQRLESLHVELAKTTMSAKSLGTLHVIYAVDEQQNPLPRKTMLCGGDTNSTGGGNDVFPSSLGLRQSIQQCIRGERGSQLLFLQRKRTGIENSYHCMGVPRTFGRHCSCNSSNDCNLKKQSHSKY